MEAMDDGQGVVDAITVFCEAKLKFIANMREFATSFGNDVKDWTSNFGNSNLETQLVTNSVELYARCPDPIAIFYNNQSIVFVNNDGKMSHVNMDEDDDKIVNYYRDHLRKEKGMPSIQEQKKNAILDMAVLNAVSDGDVENLDLSNFFYDDENKCTPVPQHWVMFAGNNYNKIINHKFSDSKAVDFASHIGKPLSDNLWYDLVYCCNIERLKIIRPGEFDNYTNGPGTCIIHINKRAIVEKINIHPVQKPILPKQ